MLLRKHSLISIISILLAQFTFGQSQRHSFSIGTNYTIHQIDNASSNNINNTTSLKIDNNFSFQSKKLSDNSRFFLTPLYKLDLAYNYHWTIKRNLLFSTGLAGSGRNFTLTEYPLSFKDGEPIDIPANKLYRRYYTFSVPAIVKYKPNRRISFNAGINFNYSLLSSFESSFYNTNPENTFYFTGQLGIEARLGKNWFAYCQYNQGLVNVFDDHVVLYSQLAYTGYPYRTTCNTKGNGIQMGFSKYFNPKEVKEKLKWRNFSFREVTLVDTSIVSVCIANENNQYSKVNLYIDGELIYPDMAIDSAANCVEFIFTKNKKYKLKLVSPNEEDVITTVTLTQNKAVKTKTIWKPSRLKNKTLLIKPHY